MLDLNIAIVNWKSKEDIDKCLFSLRSDLSKSGLNFLIHVVDNSRNIDGIKTMISDKYPDVVYVDAGSNIGFVRANNLAFRQTEARYYLTLNPDIVIRPGTDTVKGIIDFMESHPDVGMAGPKLLNLDGSIQLSCYRFPDFSVQLFRRLGLSKISGIAKKLIDNYLMRDFDHDKTVPVDWVMGSFMLARKEMTDKIGFFDERFFMYFEDCDWCRSSWEAGWKVYYIHDIIVQHAHRRESKGRSAIGSVMANPMTRIHLKSWLKYFVKWGMKNKQFGI